MGLSKKEEKMDKLEKARDNFEQARIKLYIAVYDTYPVGTWIRYTTRRSDLVYKVVSHTAFGYICVKRAFQEGAKQRHLDGASRNVEVYRAL
jgi:hypothetical protein